MRIGKLILFAALAADMGLAKKGEWR